MFSLKWNDLEAGIRLGLFAISVIKQRFAERKVVVTDEAGQPIVITPEAFNAKVEALHAKADQIAEGIDDRIAERHKNDPPVPPADE